MTVQPTSASTRVLLVDDHQVIREGYKRLLESAGGFIVVAEAETAPEALQAYRTTRPDVVVMDIGLGQSDGISATAEIVCEDPEANVLVFSVRESSEYVVRALDAGALGYVFKRSSSRSLREAVATVAQGRVYIQEELRILLLRGRETAEDPIQALSERQRQVLRLVVEGNSVVDVARLLGIEAKTAGHHYTQLKKKLGTESRAGLALLAVRAGVVEL